MLKIFRYIFADLARSRWSYFYFLFYLLLGFTLLFLNHNLSKAIISIMNVILVLTPLIGTIFGITYYYNSREFIELLLAQPMRRTILFMGQYFGVSFTLVVSQCLGLGLAFLAYGLLQSSAIWDFILLLVIAAFLSFIFVALAFLIALLNENRIKGFGYAMLGWLFFAILYDGIFLILLMTFSDYSIDTFALGCTLFNPIDLSRILILLQLDISALLGYTGAVFQQFFGTAFGMITALLCLSLWVVVPVIGITYLCGKKDF